MISIRAGLSGVTPIGDHLFVGGDGIDNGDFALVTDEVLGIQLGLRAGERFLSDALPNDGVDTYRAEPGPSIPGPSDPPGSVRASWNYYMHVDLGANLASLVPSGDVNSPGPLSGTGIVDSVLLSVDFDPGAGVVDFVVVDVYDQATSLGGAIDPLLIQDSQNLAFDFWGLLGAPAFNPDAEGEYTIRLTALSGLAVVAETEIQVVVGDPVDNLVSFGVQAGEPTVETIGGTPVEPTDVISLALEASIFDRLPAFEDLDALHFLDNGHLLFSTTTAVTLKGETFGGDDVIEFDGANYSLFFDGDLIVAVSRNIDAVSMLPNGNLLLSTQTSGEIYGFSFLNGDVVEVDLVGETAGLYMGLDEATLFTGANQDIDALHFDPVTGDLLVSVATGGSGTIGGLAYAAAEADVFELDLSAGVDAGLFLDGSGLYDGATRQLDAFYVPEPGGWVPLGMGAAFLGFVRRSLQSRLRRCHPA